jgi:hypothetical protein
MDKLVSTHTISFTDALTATFRAVIGSGEVSQEAKSRLQEECRTSAERVNAAMDPFADLGVLAFANAFDRAITMLGILGTQKIANGVTASGKTSYVKIPCAVRPKEDKIRFLIDAGCEWASVPNPTAYVLALTLRSEGVTSFGLDPEDNAAMDAFVQKSLKVACSLVSLSTGPKQALYQVFGAALATPKVLDSVVKSIDANSAVVTPEQEIANA